MRSATDKLAAHRENLLLAYSEMFVRPDAFMLGDGGIDSLDIVLGDVSNRLAALSDESFKCEVVGGGQTVVPVVGHIYFGFLESLLKRIFCEIALQDTVIDRNRLHADLDAGVILYRLYLLIPGVGFDIGDRKPRFGVGVEN